MSELDLATVQTPEALVQLTVTLLKAGWVIAVVQENGKTFLRWGA